MELWTVGNKTIMLLFVVTATYFTAAARDVWLVFLFLAYLALNLILHIVKQARTKKAILLAIILFSIGCAVYHPYFALLLPLSFNEFASFYPRSTDFCCLRFWLRSWFSAIR